MKEKPKIEDAHKVLSLAVGILSKWNYHLDGGTLLGFWRDGDFCKDDHDDIDVTVYGPSLDEVIKAFRDKGFDVYHEWPGDKENKWTPQASFLMLGVKVDVMLKSRGRKWANWTVYGNPKTGPVFKRTPLSLTGKCDNWIFIVGNEMKAMSVPSQTEKYLAYRYGDWRTPIHRSQYSCYSRESDRSIVK